MARPLIIGSALRGAIILQVPKDNGEFLDDLVERGRCVTEGPVIDALTIADAAAAAALSAEFGWPHRAADWALFLRIGHGIAWREDGVLAGTAVWFPLGNTHASIGLVQVAPGLQGRGIGRRLMAAAMDDAQPRSLMLHATAEGAGLYAKLGFRMASVVEQWQGLCTAAASGDNVRLAAPEDRTMITQLDHATRVARDTVLDVWMQDATVAVAGSPGALTGYAVRRHFGRGQLIGPLVATDEPTALTLLAFLTEPGFLRIDIPAGATMLSGWLAAAGLSCVAKAQMMLRGDWPASRGGRVWAPATQALG